MENTEILTDFQIESKNLIDQMVAILEECEGKPDQVQRLEQYGQVVDRIMGAAKSISLEFKDSEHLIHKIGDYAALCKAVGYKGSQIANNNSLYEICVALLMDATEVLQEMVDGVAAEASVNIKEFISQTLIDRVRWLSSQFGADFRTTLGSEKKKTRMSQDEIDGLLKKLGLG